MSWWDPISWGHEAEHLWDTAFGALTSGFDWLKEWVLRVVNLAIANVENDIADVGAAVGSIAASVDSLVGSVVSDLARGLDAVWNGIAQGVSDAEHFAEQIGHDAEHYAETAAWAIAHDVADPLWHAAMSGLDALRHEAAHEVDVVVHDVVDPIGHLADDAARWANDAVSWIDHSGMDAVHLVERCWRFLEWVADHPAAALEALPALLERDFVAPVLEDVESSATTVWDELDKSLSELVPAAEKKIGI